MVLQRRLDYGFNGYQVPATPRAARSTRGKSAFKKKDQEDNRVSAFELLAAVEVLLEGGNSSTSSNNTSANGDQCVVSQIAVNKESGDEDQTLKVENYDQEDARRGFFVSEIVPEDHQTQCFEEFSSPLNNTHFGVTSIIKSSDSSVRFTTLEMVNRKPNNKIRTFAGDCNEPDCDGELYTKERANNDGKVLAEVVVKNELYYEDPIPQSAFPITQDDVNLVSRDDDDDDENSSACTDINNDKTPFRSTPRIGGRRIRKILASKYWKVSSKPKEAPLSKADVDLKPGYCSRNNYYKRLRSERNYPIKKRRYFNYFSVSNTHGGDSSSEGISGSPQKGINGDESEVHKASAASSSVAGQQTSFHSRESHVKLRIKSFSVPELLIEIPETATVGSLKRTVLEAATAILGSGLDIGVLVEGRKIRDDEKTLVQTGISQDIQTDTLGFCLEPIPSQSPQPLCPKDSNFLLPFTVPQPLTRFGLAKPGNLTESDHDSADKNTMQYSRALVNVQPLHADAITVIPPRKSKRFEVAQRRVRRPFSVAEVEALVQAVEKLGTGRWRDVKLRAFDNAKHRTYVDLKDKWKTLVHTARISPQQRRGEAVPQELLDRVLTAHAYWSQQQGKHHQQQLNKATAAIGDYPCSLGNI